MRRLYCQNPQKNQPTLIKMETFDLQDDNDFFLGYEDYLPYPDPEEEYPRDDEEEEWKKMDDFAHFLREQENG